MNTTFIEAMTANLRRNRDEREEARMRAYHARRLISPALIIMGLLDFALPGVPDRLRLTPPGSVPEVGLRRGYKEHWMPAGLTSPMSRAQLLTEFAPARVMDAVIREWGGQHRSTPELRRELQELVMPADMSRHAFISRLDSAFSRVPPEAQWGFLADPMAHVEALDWPNASERARDMMKALENRGGALVEHPDPDTGRCVLHDWARLPNPREDSLHVLMEAGANPNADDLEGRSPLHEATAVLLEATRSPSEHQEMRLAGVSSALRTVRLLREVGAVPQTPDDRGETPEDGLVQAVSHVESWRWPNETAAIVAEIQAELLAIQGSSWTAPSR